VPNRYKGTDCKSAPALVWIKCEFALIILVEIKQQHQTTYRVIFFLVTTTVSLARICNPCQTDIKARIANPLQRECGLNASLP